MLELNIYFRHSCILKMQLVIPKRTTFCLPCFVWRRAGILLVCFRSLGTESTISCMLAWHYHLTRSLVLHFFTIFWVNIWSSLTVHTQWQPYGLHLPHHLSSRRISVSQSLSAAGHLSAIYWFQMPSLLQSSWLQRVCSIWSQLDKYENHPFLKAHLLMHPINTTLKITLILPRWHKPLISAFRTHRASQSYMVSLSQGEK